MLFINGAALEAPRDITLMELLRSMGLTSVKNGCAQGACGTCTVIINGVAQKACVKKLSRLEGARVTTAEGLTAREKAVYSHAFAAAGAVQCGFCTPGMVMCAKALIDAVPLPTALQVKEAIKNNLCRCTGYVKIEKAILLASRIFAGLEALPQRPEQWGVGAPSPRADAASKTLGTALYCDDLVFEGMVHVAAVRSLYPRARVLEVDVCAATAHPLCAGAFTARDIPGQRLIGHLRQDWPVLVAEGEITHTLGDAVALVAAEKKEALEELKRLVKVRYEELPGVFSPEEALAEGAPLVHPEGNVLSRERLARGDAEGMLKKSAFVVTQTYRTPFTEHAFLEPECAVALMEGDVVRIYSSDQGIYQTRHECAAMLGLEPERVRVTAAQVGGGFGGKEDMTVQPLAALVAYKTGRPAKATLTRDESILVHPKRHPMTITLSTGCDERGRLTAMKAVILADTGAYASLGGPVLQRACTHAAGPYNYQDIDVEGTAVYTNNPPAGAFRGFGVTQSCFATEGNLDRLAKLVGISPFDIRLMNAIRPGQTLPNGQLADESTALVETLEAVREFYHNEKYVGLACAMKNSGIGVGLPDIGRCRIAVEGGLAHIRTSAACIGQGLGTILAQLVCQTAGLAPDRVVHDVPDTLLSPDSGNTTASRQTLFTGEAARLAAQELKAAMEALGPGGREDALHGLEGREFYGQYSGKTDKLGSDLPHPVSHVAYGYATHAVALNEDGSLKKVLAAHDVGRAINPLSLEGQIEGGVVMGLGYGLTERFPLVRGKPQAKLGALGLFKVQAVPVIQCVVVGREVEGPAMGAKGVGEIAAIPTAPALAGAYAKLDGRERTQLPLEGTFYEK